MGVGKTSTDKTSTRCRPFERPARERKVEVMMLTLRTLLITSVATLAVCGPTIAQEAPSKSIFTSGEKGAYHTLFCPPLPVRALECLFPGL